MLLLLECREGLVRRGVSVCSYGEVGLAALGRCVLGTVEHARTFIFLFFLEVARF